MGSGGALLLTGFRSRKEVPSTDPPLGRHCTLGAHRAVTCSIAKEKAHEWFWARRSRRGARTVVHVSGESVRNSIVPRQLARARLGRGERGVLEHRTVTERCPGRWG